MKICLLVIMLMDSDGIAPLSFGVIGSNYFPLKIYVGEAEQPDEDVPAVRQAVRHDEHALPF
jgi:hypothetical protein